MRQVQYSIKTEAIIIRNDIYALITLPRINTTILNIISVTESINM